MRVIDINANKFSLTLLVASALIFSIAIFNGAIEIQQCNSMKDAQQDSCEKATKELPSLDVAAVRAKRNMGKMNEITKYKMVRLGAFAVETNPTIRQEFERVYHVKA